jgi:hypothetical protein
MVTAAGWPNAGASPEDAALFGTPFGSADSFLTGHPIVRKAILVR